MKHMQWLPRGVVVASSASLLAHAAMAQTLPAPPVSPAPVTTYEYDAQGNRTKVTKAPTVSGLNLQTKVTYDPLSRVNDSTDPKNGKTQFQYDGGDRTTQVTDPRNLVTKYPRNGLGDATQLISPDTGTATQTYDEEGNLKTRLDSRGVLATYNYDAESRLTSVVYTQSGQTTQTVSWGYDLTGSDYSNSIGRLSRTDHPNGASRFKYDPQGRVTDAIQAVYAASGGNSATVVTTVKYGYTLGKLTSITYPSGRKLIFTYTGGQLTAMSLAKDASSTAAPLISQVKWEPFGPPSSWQWQMASGLVPHERFYDQYGRIVRYRLGSVFRDISYDAADRIVSYTHLLASNGAAQPALDQGFGYDENGRLTGITTATASWAIAYDANGNRTSVSLNGSASAYTTSTTSNRLDSITNPARSLGYDNAGNTTSDSTNYTATYGLSGVLASVTKGGVTSTFSYDADRRRIRKFTSAGAGSTRIFVYDLSGHLLGEYDQAGVAQKEYVWLGSTPIAVFTADPSNASNPPWVYVIHADHLDTPRIVMDQNGGRRWRWLAEPFGTTAPESNPDNLGAFAFNLRFPGQYADQETGLSYNYFRNYDAALGRYSQSDPIGLGGGINGYTYVAGNPLSWVDERGLDNPGMGPYGRLPKGSTTGGSDWNPGPPIDVSKLNQDTLLPLPPGTTQPPKIPSPALDDPCVLKYLSDYYGSVLGFMATLGNMQQFLPSENPDWLPATQEGLYIADEKILMSKLPLAAGEALVRTHPGNLAVGHVVGRGLAIYGGTASGTLEVAGAFLTPFGTAAMAQARINCTCPK